MNQGSARLPRDSTINAFISYSHHDQAFVRRLHSALTAVHRVIWVDWNDMPPSATWQQEIYDNIEAAENFIFVLSPDSIASDSCRREVAHAQENKKRIIPIVVREVDPKAVPSDLAAIHWIFCRENDGFDHAFSALNTSLDTDLAYVGSSTKLLLRAKTWRDQGHNRGFALRGAELADAERWLAEGANKTPGPTSLQTRFITESRRTAAANRMWFISGVAAVLLVVTVLSSILSFSIYTSSQTIAGQNRVLRSQVLAAKSHEVLLTHHVDQALLLGLKASQIDDNFDTRNALLDALEYNPYLETQVRTALSGRGDTVAAITFTKDGHMLLAATQSGTLLEWDVTADQEVAHFETGLTIRNAVFSADGSTAAILESASAGSPSGINPSTVSLWNLRTGAKLPGPTFDTPDACATNLIMSPDGNLLAWLRSMASDCSDEQLVVWDVTTARFIAQMPSDALTILFSPDGKQIGSWGALQNSLTLWDATTGTSAVTILPPASGYIQQAMFSPDGSWIGIVTPHRFLLQDRVSGRTAMTYEWPDAQGDIYSMRFSPDGKFAVLNGETRGSGSYIADSQSRMAFVDTAHLLLLGTKVTQHGTFAAAFCADGHTLLVANEGTEHPQTLQLWDVRAEQPISPALVASDALTAQYTASSDGLHFASSDSQGNILLWRLRPFGLLSVAPWSAAPNPRPAVISAAAFSTDERTMASVDGDGNLALWDVRSGRQLLALATGGPQASALAFSPDGRVLAEGTVDRQIILWNISERMKFGAPLRIQATTVLGLAFSADGHLLLSREALGGFGATVWDVSSGDAILHVDLGNLSTFSAASLSPDGRSLAVGGTNGSIAIWDVRTGKVSHLLTGSPTFVGIVQYSPDGQTLASMGTDGTAIIWDLKASRLLRRINLGNAPPLSAFASLTFGSGPHGRQLLVVAFSNEIAVWDVKTADLVFRPLIESQIVGSATMSPDGQLLATAEMNGLVAVRFISPEGWQKQACEIAHRNLTHDEWRQYFGGDTYTKVCSAFPIPPDAMPPMPTSSPDASPAGATAQAAIF